MSAEGGDLPGNVPEEAGVQGPGPTVQEISGGRHGQTYMGGQFGQYIGTQVNKTYNPVGSTGKPHKEGEFQVGSLITVHENCPISLSSRIFNATLHSGVTGDKKAAVKITPAEKNNYREAKIHFSVPHHKNIVERIATDTFNFRGQPSIYIAMECCDCDLYDHVQSEKSDKIPFDAEKYIWIAYQILEGLNCLHSFNVIHGDLKPSNILLILNGNIVKLSDFGLSKPITRGKKSTYVTSPQAGTMGWQAPEVLKRAEKITTATDIFPGGLVLYFVFSHGEHAYGNKPHTLTYFIAEGINQDLSKMRIPNSDIAKPLVRRMLESDPAKRPTAKQALASKVFYSLEPKTPRVRESKLHKIVTNAIDIIQNEERDVQRNQSHREEQEVMSLGVTIGQLSNAMKVIFKEKKIDLAGEKQATDTELQDIIDKAMKQMGDQGGKVKNNEDTEDEKTSLRFTVGQLANSMKQVFEKNEVHITGRREVTDTELQEILHKAVRHMEGQGGKVRNDRYGKAGYKKTSLGFTVDKLANAMKQVFEKNKLHLTDMSTCEEAKDQASGKAERLDKKTEDPQSMKPGAFEVFIKTFSGRVFTLKVIDSDPVWRVKHLITYRERIPPDQQSLSYDDVRLSDDYHTLSQYNIENKSTITLTERTMVVFVFTKQGKSISFYVVASDTIKSVKVKIEHVEGIPVERQRLSYAGRQLEDDLALMDYNIQAGSSIHVVSLLESIRL